MTARSRSLEELSPLETKVVRAYENLGEEYGLPLRLIAKLGDIPLDKVRRPTRSLVRKGVLERGAMFDMEDGLLRGTGFFLTDKGLRLRQGTPSAEGAVPTNQEPRP